MNVKKLKRALFYKFLPLSIRESVFRKYITAPSNEDLEGFVFKLATTMDEIMQAYNLVYEEYLQMGLVKESLKPYKVTKYSLLPSSSILIVKKGDEVIATMSHIMDSPMGLPLEELWPLDSIRTNGKRIAEISALAIKKNFRRARGVILLPLMKLLYHSVYEYFGTDTLVIATHPYAAPFYSGLLGFGPLSKKIHRFSKVEGALAQGQILEVHKEDFINHLKKVNLKNGVNLFNYFSKEEITSIIKPEAQFCENVPLEYRRELLEFTSKEKITKSLNLNNFDQIVIATAYHYNDYLEKMGLNKDPNLIQRSEPRFTVNTLARVAIGTQIFSTQVIDISREGLFLKAPGKEVSIQIGDSVKLSLNISQNIKVKLEGRVRRSTERGVALNITSVVHGIEHWDIFISYLEGKVDPQKIEKSKEKVS